MAHPKRRQSPQRSRKRRTHDRHKLSGVSNTECAQCGAPKLTHRVCGACGYYAGRKVVEGA